MEVEPELKEPDKIEKWEWHDLNNLPSPIFKPVEIILDSYFKSKVYKT